MPFALGWDRDGLGWYLAHGISFFIPPPFHSVFAFAFLLLCFSIALLLLFLAFLLHWHKPLKEWIVDLWIVDTSSWIPREIWVVGTENIGASDIGQLDSTSTSDVVWCAGWDSVGSLLGLG